MSERERKTEIRVSYRRSAQPSLPVPALARLVTTAARPSTEPPAFFAAAAVFESGLPVPGDTYRNSVVILRLRRRSDLGTTFMEVVRRYAVALAAVDSKLVLV
jgi:hypothetical protein